MTATFYVGDAIKVMSKLPEKSVDLVLTSPPFLALRSYLPADHPDKALEGGSQSTPGAFIDWLIDVVEACDRVLAPHGSLCIELGDTYAGSGGAGGDYKRDGWRAGQPEFRQGHTGKQAGKWEQIPGKGDYFKGGGPGGTGWPLAKSLSLIPELFRLTLVYGFNPLTGRQTERWRLRNVVRWVRPNPPVGALGDKFRPATSELMVFCKSAKRYFDLDAVRYPSDYHRESLYINKETPPGQRPNESQHTVNPAGAPPLDWWNIPLLEGEEETRYGPKEPQGRRADTSDPRLEPNKQRANTSWNTLGPYSPDQQPLGAPPLDWWNIPPGGYEGAHYAVFPPELCVKPIKAMCPEKVCRVCGEPSRRIVGEAEYVQARDGLARPDKGGRSMTDESLRYVKGMKQIVDGRDNGMLRVASDLGFSDCGHDDWRPGLVLDPFGGSGTTALVATGHGRDCILIDLDERNFDLALQRVGPFILERAS